MQRNSLSKKLRCEAWLRLIHKFSTTKWICKYSHMTKLPSVNTLICCHVTHSIFSAEFRYVWTKPKCIQQHNCFWTVQRNSRKMSYFNVSIFLCAAFSLEAWCPPMGEGILGGSLLVWFDVQGTGLPLSESRLSGEPSWRMFRKRAYRQRDVFRQSLRHQYNQRCVRVRSWVGEVSDHLGIYVQVQSTFEIVMKILISYIFL